MLDTVFLTVNEWMSAGSAVAALGCFLWGLISVLFSPCHMASIPLIIAYVGGQKQLLKPAQAGVYSVVFTLGLFITIAVIGLVCALLGRMLGDVGTYWQIPVGLVLIWVSFGMLGAARCSMWGGLPDRLNIKGRSGAFVLGLAYGILSGSCTFGFIAPILALITIQESMSTGLMMILLFAMGHCLPIVLAGSFMAAIRNILENSAWQGAGQWCRRGAGVFVFVLGMYFVLKPFLAA